MLNVGARIESAKTGMEEAIARLRSGKLVAFPTETVYGLGANALDAEAVGRIFTAKGRPSTNPLIVHVAAKEAARALSPEWPDQAEALANRFWPGPLTLVLKKTGAIPEIVTAGGATVGIRVPAHPVALELLQRSGLPLAGPSANRSEQVSPTTALHVADSLGPWVDDLLVLDGGAAQVGIESTVVDLTGSTPRILRPGILTGSALGFDGSEVDADFRSTDEISRSPGQHLRHYAPLTPLILLPQGEVPQLADNEAYIVWNLIRLNDGDPENIVCLPGNPSGYAAQLYGTLRKTDTLGYIRIYVEMPPDTEEWSAVRDRLYRAAAKKI